MTTAYGHPLTPEDVAIWDRLAERSAVGQRLAEYCDDERIDNRAMIAREVFAERQHRIAGTMPFTPADIVDGFGDSGLRLLLEDENGEPLA